MLNNNLRDLDDSCITKHKSQFKQKDVRCVLYTRQEILSEQLGDVSIAYELL
jgi:hypothetical protein